MKLSAFATTFPRDSIDAVFAASASYGLRSTQFDMAAAGLDTLPEEIPDDTITEIRTAADAHGVTIDAMEGTFNMAHPDGAHRVDGLRRFEAVARACARLDVPILTLCTGSRDPDHMWRRHPDNRTPQAWADMRSTVERAVAIAEEQDIVLGVEPEINNVVESAAAARRLLDEIQSAKLKVIFDGANLFDVQDPLRSLEVADNVFADAADLVGPDVVLAHAKDITASGSFVAAGEGDLPWRSFLATLIEVGFDGALVMHSLSEQQVPSSAQMIRGLLAAL